MLDTKHLLSYAALLGRRKPWHNGITRQQSSSAYTSASSNDPIPKQPTWSVHDLLSSYPRPELAPGTLKKLHELSALIPPAEDTEEHARLKHELEEMVRLVDAVRLVDTSSVASEDAGIPDGRVRPEEKGMALSSNTRDVEFNDPEVESGSILLKHAKVTKDGYYVVEGERRRNKNR